jgi:hypothetical protein
VRQPGGTAPAERHPAIARDGIAYVAPDRGPQLGRHIRPSIVDRRGLPAFGIDEDRCRARFALGEPEESLGDVSLVQQGADPPATGAGDQAGGEHGAAQGVRRAGDVEPLAAGQNQLLGRVTALPGVKARDKQDAIERAVEGDGSQRR